ncbi:MAG TPA: decaprenyl-phosphate phosphoribosyltransferase [Syntrophales bacterium]|nr:decaprenyl-phosphate phosphoribosyltransferase [Syntrophales bacterium]HOM08408.1 decaprenyl-phosphate phosphoribosyltransferase [Syntrophales bacterium]HOO00986.1 decaprenyl-phosphate phosphoribosyltransferase [Syntrophales bacterium]
MGPYIELLRIHQWTKNLFIFLPLFFSLSFFDPHLLAKVFLVFLLFSLLASAQYIYNDYRDVEEDRKHPVKRNRPLASGRVSPRKALTMSLVLTVISLAGLLKFGEKIIFLSFGYLLINYLYTIKLKHVAIIDVFIIAIGFVIRIFIGGYAAGVQIYPWIVVMTFLLALFLGLGKRRDEVSVFLNTGQKTRKSIDGYTVNFIDVSMVIMASVVIVAYLMYTLSPDIVAKYKTNHLYLSSMFVIFGIMRYLQMTIVEEKACDPSDILMEDRLLQISVIGWLVTIGLLIY